MDPTDKYFEFADKRKRNALALLARTHSEITMSSLEARDHARSACGSRSCIKRLRTIGGATGEGVENGVHPSWGAFTPATSSSGQERY
jgi:hypothetical protein